MAIDKRISTIRAIEEIIQAKGEAATADEVVATLIQRKENSLSIPETNALLQQLQRMTAYLRKRDMVSFSTIATKLPHEIQSRMEAAARRLAKPKTASPKLHAPAPEKKLFTVEQKLEQLFANPAFNYDQDPGLAEWYTALRNAVNGIPTRNQNALSLRMKIAQDPEFKRKAHAFLAARSRFLEQQMHQRKQERIADTQKRPPQKRRQPRRKR